ncbi:MAG: energy-coupling factor transporter ATPase [Oscillospiraceae bacterium]|jgi:energy-coupling factor transport system ATP-binding protein
MEIIRCENVTFAYPISEGAVPAAPVLQDVSLSIARGEFVAVLGHNGSGKSTLAKHFNAILTPTMGQVLVDGIDTREEERLLEIRSRVGMVFQNPDNQIVATVVEEDVAFALENLGVPPQEIRLRVDEALAAVGMSDFKLHAPHQLSGGQKQRVAIAGIIAMRPDCIVLDEPTAMLDPRGRREVMRTLHHLNQKHGITIVHITHYMDEAAQAQRVVVMDGGKILLDNNPQQVFSHVELLTKVGLDVPQATRLCHELKREGLDLPADIITEEHCTQALLELLKA